MKKTLALVLAIVMIFALAAPVMADNTTATATGSITIENAVKGQTYKLYRMFELESVSADGKAFSYSVAPGWENLCLISGASDYLEYDESGDKLYVKWIAEDEAASAQFAKLAREYVTNADVMYPGEGPEVVAEKVAEGNTVVFTDLPLGYYLVDSSLGLICSLGTTNTDVTVQEKNDVPTLEKKVWNEAANAWTSATTAMPGETVKFKIDVKVNKGAQNYTIHDHMDGGLKLSAIDSVKVNGTVVPEKYYRIVSADKLCDNCKSNGFEIHFIDATWITADNGSLGVKPGDVITVEYTAVFSETGGEAKNFASLAYGDGQKTPEDDATVKNFGFIFVKWDGRKTVDNANLKDAVLFTAQFKLFDANGNVISFVQPDEDEINACWYGTKLQTLRYNVWNEATDAADTKTEIIMAGLTEIQGLKAGTYYLEEIAAPDGFNKLNERLTVVVGENGVVTIDNAGPALALDEGEAAETFVVVNNTGAELPSTGGIGTTVFYIVGGLLMVGAAVVLVSRRKVSAED